MLERECVGDNFKMFTLANQHSKDVTNIKILSPTLSLILSCQHQDVTMNVSELESELEVDILNTVMKNDNQIELWFSCLFETLTMVQTTVLPWLCLLYQNPFQAEIL